MAKKNNDVQYEFDQDMKDLGARLASGVTIVPKPRKTFTPCGHLIALHTYQQDRTKGGLALPEGVKDPFVTVRAEVIAIGPEVTKQKVGDIVLVHIEQRSTAIYHRGYMVYLMHEDHILGIEDPEVDTLEKT